MPCLLDSKALCGGVTRGPVLSGAILAARIPRRLGRMARQKAEVARGKTPLLKWTRLALLGGDKPRSAGGRGRTPHTQAQLWLRQQGCGLIGGERKKDDAGRTKNKNYYILGSAAVAIPSSRVVTHEVSCQSSPPENLLVCPGKQFHHTCAVFDRTFHPFP